MVVKLFITFATQQDLWCLSLFDIFKYIYKHSEISNIYTYSSGIYPSIQKAPEESKESTTKLIQERIRDELRPIKRMLELK